MLMAEVILPSKSSGRLLQGQAMRAGWKGFCYAKMKKWRVIVLERREWDLNTPHSQQISWDQAFKNFLRANWHQLKTDIYKIGF